MKTHKIIRVYLIFNILIYLACAVGMGYAFVDTGKLWILGVIGLLAFLLFGLSLLLSTFIENKLFLIKYDELTATEKELNAEYRLWKRYTEIVGRHEAVKLIKEEEKKEKDLEI